MNNSQLLLFCGAFLADADEFSLSARLEKAQAGEAVTRVFLGLADGDYMMKWSEESGLPRSAFEILKGSFLNAGYFDRPVELVRDYYKNLGTFSGGELFIRNLDLTMNEVSVAGALNLLVADHPEEPFRELSRKALMTIETGLGLSAFFSSYEQLLGSEFIARWKAFEAP